MICRPGDHQSICRRAIDWLCSGLCAVEPLTLRKHKKYRDLPQGDHNLLDLPQGDRFYTFGHCRETMDLTIVTGALSGDVHSAQVYLTVDLSKDDRQTIPL